MSEKRITVLLATHNSERFLTPLLDSLFAQDEGDLTVFISDDGSRDATPRLLQEAAARDERVVLAPPHAPLGSAKANFWFLLQNAPESDYYLFCDHDDVWLKHKVRRTREEMEAGDVTKPRLVHTDLRVTDGEMNVLSDSLFALQKLSKHQDLAHTLIQNNVTGCTVMINEPLRRLALQKADTEQMLMHDWFLAILALAAGSVGFVDEPLLLYRQHAGNEVGAKNAGSLSYLFKKLFTGAQDRESLHRTRLQAAMIARSFEGQLGPQEEMIRAYGESDALSKRQRRAVCRRWGIYKNTLLRRLGQWLYQ